MAGLKQPEAQLGQRRVGMQVLQQRCLSPASLTGVVPPRECAVTSPTARQRPRTL